MQTRINRRKFAGSLALLASSPLLTAASSAQVTKPLSGPVRAKDVPESISASLNPTLRTLYKQAKENSLTYSAVAEASGAVGVFVPYLGESGLTAELQSKLTASYLKELNTGNPFREKLLSAARKIEPSVELSDFNVFDQYPSLYTKIPTNASTLLTSIHTGLVELRGSPRLLTSTYLGGQRFFQTAHLIRVEAGACQPYMEVALASGAAAAIFLATGFELAGAALGLVAAAYAVLDYAQNKMVPTCNH